MVKNLPANAGDGRDVGLIPVLGRAWQLSTNILAWRIPWTEEPGGLQSMWSQNVLGLHTCMGLMTPLFLSISPFWNGYVCPKPPPPLHFRNSF